MMFKEVGCKMQIAVSDLKCIFAVNRGIGCYLGGGCKATCHAVGFAAGVCWHGSHRYRSVVLPVEEPVGVSTC